MDITFGEGYSVHNAKRHCVCVQDSIDILQIHGVGTPHAHHRVYQIFQALGFATSVPVYYGNVGNAASYRSSSICYIVYNSRFFSRLHPVYPVIPIIILAHEVGHIVGRYQESPNSHIRELEADRISGYVMKKFGATAEQAILKQKLFPNKASSSHPSSALRKQAILEGYNACP